jgi:N-acyl-D-amino-acid deacylase
MKKYSIIIILVISLMGFKRMTDRAPGKKEISTAITKGLGLLQRSSHTFLVNAGGCHSCHGQGLGAVVFSLAMEKGFPVEDSIYKEALDSITSTWKDRMRYLAQNTDPVAIVIGGGYDLWAYAATKTQPGKLQELLAKNIMQRQRKDGSWVSPNARPPMEYYSFSATAMAVKGLQTYLPPVFKKEWEQRVAKARQWMMSYSPAANEEKAFQLLGMSWTKGDPLFIKKQAQKLLASQHPDGGWSQLDSLPSDAYATGQSLYALYTSGQLRTNETAYQKGLTFLLRTQASDGSWNVQTRSFPSVPYVDSGFPHGDNQFIAAAGTNWAVMALLVAVQ